MGSPRLHGDTIESLIRERRKTEEEARQLQKEIERIGAEKAASNVETAALDEEISRLTQLKKEKAVKLTEICRVARTISAGD